MKKTVIGFAIVLALGAAWFLFRPELLFVNKAVNESFPGTSAQAAGAAAADRVVARGDFVSLAHETKGAATIHVLAGGKRILRLTDFQTSNGPDVRVFLVAAPDARDSETVKKAGYIELGKLKGNVGDQNYDIPADVDLEKYRAVTIWCNRFGVNFGTAALAAGGA
jgi:hypothetical protein